MYDQHKEEWQQPGAGACWGGAEEKAFVRDLHAPKKNVRKN